MQTFRLILTAARKYWTCVHPTPEQDKARGVLRWRLEPAEKYLEVDLSYCQHKSNLRLHAIVGDEASDLRELAIPVGHCLLHAAGSFSHAKALPNEANRTIYVVANALCWRNPEAVRKAVGLVFGQFKRLIHQEDVKMALETSNARICGIPADLFNDD